MEMKCHHQDCLLVGLICKSDSGTETNNDNLLVLLEGVSAGKYLHKLIMGDLNLPNIDWNSNEAKGNHPTLLDNRFLDCIQNALLFQHVYNPTRWRSGDTPTVLDLIVKPSR